jgi:hypothetical protein
MKGSFVVSTALAAWALAVGAYANHVFSQMKSPAQSVSSQIAPVDIPTNFRDSPQMATWRLRAAVLLHATALNPDYTPEVRQCRLCRSPIRESEPRRRIPWHT